MSNSAGGRQDVDGRIVEVIARALALAPEAIPPDDRLSDYGLDSRRAAQIVVELSKVLEQHVPPTLFWDHPTLAGAVAAVAGRSPSIPLSAAASTARNTRNDTGTEPIALIGISCRFPGATGPQAFWSLLGSGVDAITEVPTDRWDIDRLFNPDIATPGKVSTRWGGFIKGVREFDPDFFGISPREAQQMDPQQRLLLECTWAALEDGGLAPPTLRGSNTSVNCGAMWTDYARVAQQRLEDIVQHTATGQDLSILANRISYAFGFEGPSLCVNTACSSSLVAVHLACETLRSGESDIAIAGAANLLLAPESAIAMSKLGAMAPDGRCKAFDHRANGYVRGEGVAVLVLKRMSRAIADGDRIYCSILGGVVNNDGYSNGLTAPNPRAQIAMLRAAYQRAGVDPLEVDYVEAHGTGTGLGDPIEANALGTVLGRGRDAGRPLLIGSVKTNIGHLEAAAGMAGLIKVALSLRAGVIPPSLHFEAPNPHIDFTGLGLEVVSRARPWPRPDRLAVAGVSSFGFGGTNCHVVVRQGAPLRPLLREDPAAALPVAKLAPVFVCSGHGAQWPGMARDLIAAEPVFRAALAECDEVLRPLTGWSTLERLVVPDVDPEIPVDRAQPLIFAVQVALAALWRHRGVLPSAVVGHSLGEVAAAHISGALSLRDAASIVYHRSRLIARTSGQGGMGVVGLSAEDLPTLLDPYGGALSVAACNGPRTTIVSGSPGPLRLLLADLESRGVFCRLVRADFASHNAQLDPVKQELFQSLEGIQPVRCAVPLVSTVTGDHVDGARLNAAYWVRNLRQPVLFSQAIQRLASEGHHLFLEVSPDAILASSVKECLGDSGGQVFASLKRDEPASASLTRSWQALCEAAGRQAEAGGVPSDSPAESRERVQLFVRSAHTEPLLRELTRADAEDLAGRQDPGLEALCYTAAVRRAHQRHRLAVSARSTAELIERLQAFNLSGRAEGVWTGRSQPRKVVFVFPGQGSQWLGMARRLLAEEPLFRHSVALCDRMMADRLDTSILSRLEAGADVDRDQLTQPTLFAVQVALNDLWRSWGLVPDAVLGHSFGEVAAAYAAGALSLEDAVDIVCARREAMRGLSKQGAMAMVELSSDLVQHELAGRAGVGIAAVNSRLSTIVSGDRAEVESMVRAFEARGVFSRLLNVDVAGHSAHVDEHMAKFTSAIDRIRARPSAVAFHSSVTGDVRDGLDLDASYWVRNLRQPVMFAKATEQLLREGYDAFLEISPHPIVSPAIEQSCQSLAIDGIVIPTLRRGQDERACLLAAVARLHVEGVGLDWSRIARQEHEPVSLAALPFRREIHWPEVERRSLSGRRQPVDSPGHPFLAGHRTSPFQAHEHSWEVDVDLDQFPWLKDHQVQGEVWLPAVSFIEMALAASRDLLGTEALCLSRLELNQSWSPEANGSVRLQVGAALEVSEAVRIEVSSAADAAGNRTLYASARATRFAAGVEEDAWTPEPMEEQIDANAHYESLERRRLCYGPAFRGVRAVTRSQRSAVIDLRTESVSAEGGSFLLPPGLIDAGLQALLALIADRDLDQESNCTWVPVGVDRLDLHGPASTAVQCRLRLADREARHSGDLLFLDDRGQPVLKLLGVRYVPLPEALEDVRWVLGWRQLPATAATPVASAGGRRWLILAPDAPPGLLADLQREAERKAASGVFAVGGEVFRECSPGHFELRLHDQGHVQRLLDGVCAAAGGGCEAVVFVASDQGRDDRGQPGTGDIESLTVLIQALATREWRQPPKLLVATMGAQAALAEDTVPNVGQSGLWGFVRVAQLEHPEFFPAIVDLDPDDHQQWANAVATEIVASDSEGQVAWRGGTRYGARLRPAGNGKDGTRAVGLRPVDPARLPVRLQVGHPGDLDRICATTFVPTAPRAGEVEIDVLAAGVNFLDVLKALGRYPGVDPEQSVELGAECVGRVRRVGSGVTSWSPGDEVIAISPGTLASRVRVPDSLVARKPRRMAVAEAAAIPVAYATAYFALSRLANVQPGETVLIHSAATGTGLAAVAVARALGAKVLATAGTDKKRDHLRAQGVEWVMDSRRGGFVEEVRRLTAGRGVDVVLNSLLGASMASSLDLLAPYGRFVEIAKRAIYEDRSLGLKPFSKALTFFAVDLARMWIDDRDRLGGILREVVELFEDGRLDRMPVEVHGLSEARAAFHRMARAEHIGKLVISLEESSVPAAAPAPTDQFAGEGAYLVTGGWGGLGLAFSRWLAERGARVIALMGRGQPTPEGLARIAEIESLGASVVLIRADCANLESLRQGLAELEQVAPLRGVVHAAGVLDDATVMNLSSERIRRVMSPKVQGAWNLHQLTRDRPLDCFLMFSSITGLLGSPGQANYAAANAFLDALAHHRQAQGLPAMSVDWGPWSEVGMAARSETRGDRLVSRGLGSLSPRTALSGLARIMREGWTQIAFAPLSAERWSHFYPKAAGAPFLAELPREGSVARSPEEPGGVPAELKLLAKGSRRLALTEKVVEQLSQVLRLPPERIDAQAPLSSLGVDSLMALELRNRLEGAFALPLSTTLIWRYPTAMAIVDYLAERMGVDLDGPAPGSSNGDPSTAQALSEEEAQPLLAAIRAAQRELGSGPKPAGSS